MIDRGGRRKVGPSRPVLRTIEVLQLTCEVMSDPEDSWAAGFSDEERLRYERWLLRCAEIGRTVRLSPETCLTSEQVRELLERARRGRASQKGSL